MSNYFDNQSKWAWDIDKDRVVVTTDHGSHTHSLEVTRIPIGDMVANTGQVMGNIHRSVPHDFKSPEKEAQMNNNNFKESLKVDAETQARLLNVSKEHQSSTSKKTSDDFGGRERGDEGPQNHGRDSDFKGVEKTKVQSMQLGKLSANSNPSKVNSMQLGALARLGENGETISNSTKANVNIAMRGEHSHAAIGNSSSNSRGNSNGSHSSSTGGHGGSHSGVSGSHSGSSGGHSGASGGHGGSSGGHGGIASGHGGHK